MAPISDAVSTLEKQQEVAKGYISDFTSSWDSLGFGVWAICSNDLELGRPGEFIGYAGFIPEQIEGAGPEIAYAMKKSMWGKGLVTEALRACLGWIFIATDISCVHAVTDKGNIASRRVMEKIGMRHEKDVDLYNSVANGNGLLPFYSIDRNAYFKKREGSVLNQVYDILI